MNKPMSAEQSMCFYLLILVSICLFSIILEVNIKKHIDKNVQNMEKMKYEILNRAVIEDQNVIKYVEKYYVKKEKTE